MFTQMIGEEKYVRISNLDRISGTPSEFTINLSNEYALRECTHFWVQYVTMPHVFNNITNSNNVLDFQASTNVPPLTINGSVIIPVGQYNITQLLNEINTQINAQLVAMVGASVTFTLNVITSKIEVSFIGITIFSLFSGGSSMSQSIGLTDNIVTSSSPALFQNIPSLSGPNMIYLHCKEVNLANTILSINTPVSSFASIPVTVPYLGTIVYDAKGSNIDLIMFKGFRDMSNITVKIRSQSGEILQLGDNHEIIIVFKIFY